MNLQNLLPEKRIAYKKICMQSQAKTVICTSWRRHLQNSSNFTYLSTIQLQNNNTTGNCIIKNLRNSSGWM